MENKYYIPTIQEFHIGFKYELFSHKGGISWSSRLHDAIEKSWTKQTLEIDSPYFLVEIRNYIDSGFIRVKCLDEQDIIELGWSEKGRFYSLERIEFEEGLSYLKCYGISNNGNYFYITKINDLYMIFTVEKDSVLFKGKIKNYNELIKVMQMLDLIPFKNVKG